MGVKVGLLFVIITNNLYIGLRIFATYQSPTEYISRTNQGILLWNLTCYFLICWICAERLVFGLVLKEFVYILVFLNGTFGSK